MLGLVGLCSADNDEPGLLERSFARKKAVHKPMEPAPIITVSLSSAVRGAVVYFGIGRW